jgi:G3E family GTPase
MSAAGVNILCIAGFLGSGKTTVLLEVARAMVETGAQLAVIENEIGEVGIDGSYVREQGLPVRELFGGCVCCTLTVGLVQTLREVRARYEPDWVIIEPTGLAAPGDILGVVVDNIPEVDLIRVLCLADAERWPMLLEVVEPLVTAQVASADVVAVNKMDTVDEDQLDEVLQSVRGLAPKATVVPVSAATGEGMRRLLGAIV